MIIMIIQSIKTSEKRAMQSATNENASSASPINLEPEKRNGRDETIRVVAE
jgi:hypothetical protein